MSAARRTSREAFAGGGAVAALGAVLGGGDVRTVPTQAIPEFAQGTLALLLIQGAVVARSRLSCTRESAVLTPWPPGPEA